MKLAQLTTSRRFRLWAGGLTTLALFAVAQIWLSYLRLDVSQELQQSRAELEALQSETAQLQLELANLTRPERLRVVARKELGMASPLPMQVIQP